MTKELTFNDLPMVVAQLRDEVVGMKQMIINLQSQNKPHKANTHIPMSVGGAIGIPENADGNSHMKLWKRQHSCHQPASVTAFIKMNLTSGWRLTARILYLSRLRRRTQPFLLETSASRNP